MKIFGLTGGIASGKSTVSNIFNNELKIPIIDADILARQAVKPGSQGLNEVIKYFGNEIILPDGHLNRKALGKIVFGNPQEIKVLNRIIHPVVHELFKNQIKQYKDQGYSWVIYDCPLLIEEGLTEHVHEVILVILEEQIQLKRLMERDHMDEIDAKERIRSQMDLAEKITHSHYVIYNDGNYQQLKDGVTALWKLITSS